MPVPASPGPPSLLLLPCAAGVVCKTILIAPPGAAGTIRNSVVVVPGHDQDFTAEHDSEQVDQIKMPFKPIENPKCPKCQKSVYAAEERVAGGYKWHKSCFKCGLCGKMLDSTNCTEHEAELFCKNCHARKYGPKGYGFGGGAGCLSMDTGSHLKTDS